MSWRLGQRRDRLRASRLSAKPQDSAGTPNPCSGFSPQEERAAGPEMARVLVRVSKQDVAPCSFHHRWRCCRPTSIGPDDPAAAQGRNCLSTGPQCPRPGRYRTPRSLRNVNVEPRSLPAPARRHSYGWRSDVTGAVSAHSQSVGTRRREARRLLLLRAGNSCRRGVRSALLSRYRGPPIRNRGPAKTPVSRQV